MNEIVLQTERLLFRAHTVADREAFCAMEMDANVRRWVGGYPRLREEAEKRFAGMLKPLEGNLNMWATELRLNGAYIGRCGLYKHHLESGGFEPGVGVLAYYIAKDYWNQGYASEAAAGFTRFGFDILKLQKIITTIETGNLFSARIVENLGFSIAYTETGTRSFVHYRLNA